VSVKFVFEHVGYECRVLTLEHSKLLMTQIVLPRRRSMQRTLFCDYGDVQFALRANGGRVDQDAVYYDLHRIGNPYAAWLFADTVDAIATISAVAEHIRKDTST